MPRTSPCARRPALLAAAVAVWVTGAWLAPNAWWHLWSAFAVTVGVAVNAAAARAFWRDTRWAWAAGGLVAWQVVTVLWSDGGGWLQVVDGAGILLVLTGLGIVSRREEWRRDLVPLIVWVAFFAAVAGMAGFYLWQGHELSGERFRLPWVHGTGLNAVLTGLLCAAGGVAAMGQGARGGDRLDRVVCLLAAGCGVFGVLATRSRGALLAVAAGVIVLAWFERKRLVPGLLMAASTTGAYFLAMFLLGGGAELVERGSAGRMDIYFWFLKKMTVAEGIVGAGFGTPAVIPEAVLGWFVEHPHSAYLTQLYVTGFIGLGILLFVFGWAGKAGLQAARPGDAVWVAMLACGGMGVVFDTSLVFSLLTIPRMEPILVLLPAMMVMRGGLRNVPGPL